MSDATDAHRLGAYLRARRAAVTPEQAGIPGGAGRRVPGLRREEVAMLAGISADYYLRLERGRDTRPSAQVLDALARVLRLDDVERDYLHGLADPRPRRRARHPRPERVPPRLQGLLDGLGLPAFLEGRAYDVLASNALAVAFSPRLRPGENRLRSLLLDPGEQAFQREWAAAAACFIATFRDSVRDDVDDPRVVELVGELSLSSGRFRELWARHDVRALEGGSSIVDHPQVGELRIHREKLPVDGLTLVIYHPDGAEAAEKFAMLASLVRSTEALPG